MSIRSRPAQLSLRRVRGPLTSVALLGRTQRRFASDEPRPPSHEEKTGRSFRGQMMGSIGHRVRREREELERWSEFQHKRAAGRNWSMTFGERHSDPQWNEGSGGRGEKRALQTILELTVSIATAVQRSYSRWDPRTT